MAQQLRLDRFLSDMEIGTRSDIKVWIRNGRAKVNGEVVTKPETKVVIPTDEVTFDETRIKYATYVYYMLHKPMGVVSARVDNVNETVIDLLDDSVQRKDLSPVGRLDKDTEGLLIITNDGELSHQLLSPRKHVDKVYFARVNGKVTEEDKQIFLEGIDIGEDNLTLPAKLNIMKSDDISEVELTIQEGKFHQVKRMFEAIDKEVVYLKRLSMGGLELDENLQPGEYRELTDDEVEYLKNINKKKISDKKLANELK